MRLRKMSIAVVGCFAIFLAFGEVHSYTEANPPWSNIQTVFIILLGVRPSNRRDHHIPSCCAPTMSVTSRR